MAYPPVVIVNEKDEVVGSAMLAEAWQKGLIHRIVMVIVGDSQGRILLHKRTPTMALFPNRWDTVGGHVDVAPDYKGSALIELQEEAGIGRAELTEVAHVFCDEPYDNGVRARRFIQIYSTRYDGPPGPGNADEVVGSRWFTKQEVAQLSREHPELIAECLHRCLPYMGLPESVTVDREELAWTKR